MREPRTAWNCARFERKSKKRAKRSRSEECPNVSHNENGGQNQSTKSDLDPMDKWVAFDLYATQSKNRILQSGLEPADSRSILALDSNGAV
jgi:hypothetical protein